MRKFKIKDPLELAAMIPPENMEEIITYIDRLHSIVMEYQMTLEQIQHTIDTHNNNVTR